MTVFRADRGQLNKPVRLDNGWIKVDGYIARPGILEYQRADGSTWREYRSPEEAFKQSTLDSFAMVPLTNNHPPGGKLTAENTRDFQVGTVEKPQRDDDRVRASMLVTDAATIADIESGKVELSCGYRCNVLHEPGVTPAGERYDARQTDVVGNHVALVNIGRAGPQFRIRVDGAGEVLLPSDSIQVGNEADNTKRSAEPQLKFSISGVEYEVSEQVAQAIAKERSDSTAELTAAKTEAKTATDATAKLQARADTAASDVEKLKAELKDAPVKALAAAKARASLEAQATKLAPSVKVDGKADVEIKREVAAHVLEMKLDGKAEAYVEAMFDLAVQRSDERSPAAKVETKDIGDAASAAPKRLPSIEQIVAERNKRMREASKVKP